MNTRKRILAIVACCTLVLCLLAGCQKKAEPNVHEDETLEVSDSVQTAKPKRSRST